MKSDRREPVVFFVGVIPSSPTVNAKPNPVILYSEVTNEIGNLQSARRRIIISIRLIFAGVFEAQARDE